MRLSIFGQDTRQAKIVDVARLDIALHPHFLTPEGQAAIVRMLATAEHAGEQLTRVVALLLNDLGREGDARGAAERSPAMLSFWEAAERQFVSLMGAVEAGAIPLPWAEPAWRTRLIVAVGGAWERVTTEAGDDARALAAVARRSPVIDALTRDLIPPPMPDPETPLLDEASRRIDEADARALGVGEDELTLSDAADLLGVTRQAIQRAVTAGRLDGIQRQLPGQRPVWFVRRKDVETYRLTRHAGGRPRDEGGEG